MYWLGHSWNGTHLFNIDIQLFRVSLGLLQWIPPDHRLLLVERLFFQIERHSSQDFTWTPLANTPHHHPLTFVLRLTHDFSLPYFRYTQWVRVSLFFIFNYILMLFFQPFLLNPSLNRVMMSRLASLSMYSVMVNSTCPPTKARFLSSFHLCSLNHI